MKTFTLRSIISCIAILCIVFTMNAQENSQRKVQVNITTTENGKTTIIKKEITLENGEDVEMILKDLGVLENVGDISSGQVIEINIIRKEDNDVLKDMEIGLFMDDHKFRFFNCNDGEPRPFLGVYVESHSSHNGSEIKGAEITGIIEGEAAAASDLKEGDIITEINGVSVTGHESLVDALYANEPGDEVKIAYMRDGKKKTTKVNLGEKENEFEWNFEIDEEWIGALEGLGESLEGLEELEHLKHVEKFYCECDEAKGAFLGVTNHAARTENLAKGVALESVVGNSTAEKMGLQAGDVITSINGKETNDFKQLADILDEIEVGTSVTVAFTREGVAMSATEEIGARKSGARSFIFAPGEMDDVHFEYRHEIEGSEAEVAAERARMHEEMDRMMIEVERMRSGETDVITKEITVIIIMEDVSPEEAEMINSNSDEKIEIDNDLNVEDFKYYPNPNQGVFDLTFSVSETGITDIVIFDQKGKKVYSERLVDLNGTYNNQIDISDQASGSYFMQITQNGKTFSKKIIKN